MKKGIELFLSVIILNLFFICLISAYGDCPGVSFDNSGRCNSVGLDTAQGICTSCNTKTYCDDSILGYRTCTKVDTSCIAGCDGSSTPVTSTEEDLLECSGDYILVGACGEKGVAPESGGACTSCNIRTLCDDDDQWHYRLCTKPDTTCYMPCKPLCTNFTYSNWSECVNSVQIRTIINSTPSGCHLGSPVLNQSCGSTTINCTNFTYSNWSECVNSVQIRTIVTSLPSDCSGGTSILSRSCVISENYKSGILIQEGSNGKVGIWFLNATDKIRQGVWITDNSFNALARDLDNYQILIQMSDGRTGIWYLNSSKSGVNNTVWSSNATEGNGIIARSIDGSKILIQNIADYNLGIWNLNSSGGITGLVWFDENPNNLTAKSLRDNKLLVQDGIGGRVAIWNLNSSGRVSNKIWVSNETEANNVIAVGLGENKVLVQHNSNNDTGIWYLNSSGQILSEIWIEAIIENVLVRAFDANLSETAPITCPIGYIWNGQGCIEDEQMINCDGCIVDDICYKYGYRIKFQGVGKYCDYGKIFVNQKILNVDCDNEWECITGACSNEKCVDLLTQINQQTNLLWNILCALRHPIDSTARQLCITTRTL